MPAPRKLPRFAALLGAGILVPALASLALTSCGSSTKSSTSTLYQGSPVKGGTFREGLVTISSLDPAQAKSPSDRILADELYDGLTAWNPQNLAAVPALANRWEATPSQTSWTFHLRDDAKASNGESITADDVKASLEHVARTTTASPSADLLSNITGFKDFVSGGAAAHLVGVTSVDAKTVRIDLDTPSADLPKLMGNPTLAVTHFKADGSTTSTGPFVISSTAADNKSMTLVKSPDSKAYLDAIQVSFYADLDASYADFDKGNLDWTPVALERAGEIGAKYGTHLFRPSLRTLYLSFNLSNPKFADVRFRHAIAEAIDRTALVAKFGTDGAQVLNGLVDPGVPDAQGPSCLDLCAYDPAAAKALVVQMFPTNAPVITIDLAQGAPFNDAAAKQLTDNLAAAGIVANVRMTPVDKFGAVTVSKDREVFQTSWAAAYPAAEAFMVPLFAPGSTSNVSEFGTSDITKDLGVQITKELGVASSQPDSTSRAELFKKAENDVMSQLPVVPLAQFPTDAVAQPTVRGLITLPTANFDATAVWLAPRA